MFITRIYYSNDDMAPGEFELCKELISDSDAKDLQCYGELTARNAALSGTHGSGAEYRVQTHKIVFTDSIGVVDEDEFVCNWATVKIG
ncbi:hypothetical protein LJC59_00875 [Desulfovibrio sp. OttesenSCG-928-A18]|nr:hypothetical protein [Desulfovibrio sp. OttesenSCG-928-A18]